MNPQDPLAGVDEGALFERAAEIQEEIGRRFVFDAVVHGGKSSAAITDDPAFQEATARAALKRALGEAIQPPPRPKGSARRSAPKVSARKRQRQARRKQR